MYSIFLPFAAVVIDLCVSYIYFKHGWWLGGGITALIALIPLFLTAALLYCGWTRLRQATVFLGILHSGTQLLFQVTLLFKHWGEFGDVIINYGTLGTPQWSIVVISVIASSLVVAKSARECHFLCQAPEKNHVSASHFRATPFFLLHISFRAIGLGLVGAFLPIPAWYLILAILLLLNFVISFKIFRLPLLTSSLTSFTSVLTPSLYPSDTSFHIAFIANFHIVNSVTTTAIIILGALVNSLTVDMQYEWSRWYSNSTLPSSSTSLLAPSLAPCLASSSDCSLPAPPALPHLPDIFKLGILPPLLLAGVLYSLTVILTMGIIRPGFLELPPGTSPPPASPPGEQGNLPEKRVRSISLDETRFKVTFGRGSTTPTLASVQEDEEVMGKSEENNNTMDSTASLALGALEVERIVRMAEEEAQLHDMLRDEEDGGRAEEEVRLHGRENGGNRGQFRYSQIRDSPETRL